MTSDIWGRIHIHDGGWSIVLPAQESGNEAELSRQLQYIDRVNPRFGQSIRRHLQYADRCEMYENDTQTFSKCLISHYGMNK